MSNNSCVPCRSSHRRCMFLNVDDISCTRCRHNGIACCYIKFSGESLCSFSPAPSSPLSNVVYFHYSARGATTRCIEEKLAIFFPGANHKFFPPFWFPTGYMSITQEHQEHPRRPQAATKPPPLLIFLLKICRWTLAILYPIGLIQFLPLFVKIIPKRMISRPVA